MMLLLTSCFEKIDNWYTNTAGYDGRYVVAMTCDEYSDDDTVIEDGEELMIFNSAANIANEIIISTNVATEPIKGKFTISGTPENFQGTNKSVNLGLGTAISTANLYYAFNTNGSLAAPPTAATQAGLESEGIQFYANISIETGKITPLSKTTIGGNKSDGILLNVTAYHDYLVYESYQTPEETWAVAGTPEYAWRVKAGSRENADGEEEHWTLDGYRYTGYPEDDPHVEPPIVTK